MIVMHVVGARPNFMKAAPVVHALHRRGVTQRLVHTGQHYDASMSDVFFHELGLPEPDINLEVGSGSHAVQTAQVMQRLEPVVLAERPDWVLVYGDVNSTMAATLVCTKLGVKVAHVEAGLRSFDRTMPEEINRLVTDQLADLLLTPSQDGDDNLRREGVPADRIVRVGNVMIDTLVRLLSAAEAKWPGIRDRLGVERFALVTLHRPSNVDVPERLAGLVTALDAIARTLPVLFPVHPRTARRIEDAGLTLAPGVRLLEPLSYLDFLALQRHAVVVATDSGGIQEETSFLGVPCLTLRSNTERPVTVSQGSNLLIGDDLDRLVREVERIAAGARPVRRDIALWDGHAAERVVEAVLAHSRSSRGATVAGQP
jgi:UDP-N-acetylglucosamine 2-epimerase (non-hydrolysing)